MNTTTAPTGYLKENETVNSSTETVADLRGIGHNISTTLSPSTVDVSVVIPFYNSGPVVATTAVNALAAAHNLGLTCEVITVDDGSTDGSWLHVKGLDPHIKVVRLEQNQGKGAALRTGFAHATGKYVSMIDADGDIDADTAIRYAVIAEAQNLDIVYADKTHPLSQSASSKGRKIISTGYRTVVASLFTIDAKDTQTGCKTFSNKFIKHAITKATETGFALDLELFVIAANGNWKIKNEAVTLNERLEGSTVSRKAISRTLKDTLRIAYKNRVKKSYKTASKDHKEVLHTKHQLVLSI